jgi:hypothetical protein
MADPEGFTLLPYTDTSGLEPQETSVYVTTLPKGTVLYRGVSTVNKLYDDLYGVQTEDGSYCLPPEYNVFFYPFPFADVIVGNEGGYSHILVYVTLRDIKLATFLSPSPMLRGDRHQGLGPITSCDTINPHGCGLAGRYYDPCFKPDFRAAHPDVSGMIGIAEMDRRTFLGIANDFRRGTPLRKYFNQYVSAYTDRTGKPGIPEVILHPLVTRGAADTMTPGDTDIDAWYETHPDTASYTVWRVLPRDDAKILEFLKESTRQEGLGGVRVKLDTRTGFYVREVDADAETRAHLVDLQAEGGDWAMSRATPGFRFQRGTIEIPLSLEELKAKTSALRKRLAAVIRETRPRTRYANRMAHALAEALLRVMLITLGYYTSFDADGREVIHDTICAGRLKECGSVMDDALATLTYPEGESEEEVVGETKDFDVKLRYPIDNTNGRESEVFAKWQDIIRDRLLEASFDPKTGLYDRPKMLESAAQLVSQLLRHSGNFALQLMVELYPGTDEAARSFLTKSLAEVELLPDEHNDYGDAGWVNLAFDHPYEDTRWVDWTDENEEDEEEEGEGEPEWGGEDEGLEASRKETEAQEQEALAAMKTGGRKRGTYRRRATSLRRR